VLLEEKGFDGTSIEKRLLRMLQAQRAKPATGKTIIEI
jgi:hypothetical protein